MPVPETSEELKALSDEALGDLLRDTAYEFSREQLGPERLLEQELSIRLVLSLRAFKEAADRSSRRLFCLTVVLVVLTAAILWLTFRLD